MPAKAKPTATPTRARTQRAPMGEVPAPLDLTPASVGDLSANPKNPRKPWKDSKTRESFLHSLQSFGDLSGIVYNLTSKQLVGGHKRVAEFKADGAAAKLCVTDRRATPDASGSVAYGYVEMSNGVRFAYREVRWDKAKEAAANLAANKWGAEWDLPAVADMLTEAQQGGFDLELTGFDLPEVDALLSNHDGGHTGNAGGDNEGEGSEGQDWDHFLLRLPPDMVQKFVTLHQQAILGVGLEAYPFKDGAFAKCGTHLTIACLSLSENYTALTALTQELEERSGGAKVKLVLCVDPSTVYAFSLPTNHREFPKFAVLMVQPSMAVASLSCKLFKELQEQPAATLPVFGHITDFTN